MSTSVALKAEINTLRASVKPLMDRIDALQEQLREVQSREWIAANGVKRGDVAVPGVDMPVFLSLRAAGNWLRENDGAKRWIAWDSRVRSLADVWAGRTSGAPPPGRIEHVPP
jgi:hypothetical protein